MGVKILEIQMYLKPNMGLKIKTAIAKGTKPSTGEQFFHSMWGKGVATLPPPASATDKNVFICSK